MPKQTLTRSTHGDDTTPLVVGGWLSDQDPTAWLTDTLYHEGIDEPCAWTMVVIFILGAHLAQCKRSASAVQLFGRVAVRETL